MTWKTCNRKLDWNLGRGTLPWISKTAACNCLIFVLQTSKLFFLDCQQGLYGSNCRQNCSLTCGDPGKCDKMTGHCNGGCQVGWTGAMCEKGYHLTIYNNTQTLS